MLYVLKILPRGVFEVWQWERKRPRRMGLRLKTCVMSSFSHGFSQALQFVFVVLKPSKYHLPGETGFYLFQPIEIYYGWAKKIHFHILIYIIYFFNQNSKLKKSNWNPKIIENWIGTKVYCPSPKLYLCHVNSIFLDDGHSWSQMMNLSTPHFRESVYHSKQIGLFMCVLVSTVDVETQLKAASILKMK